MANDMQFFLTSPFIIFALWSSRRQPWKRNMGLALLGLLLVIFTAIPTVLGFVKDYPFSPMLMNGADPSSMGDYMMNFYVVPWCRSIPLPCTSSSTLAPQVPAISCRPWSWLPALQDAGSAQTFPQSNGSGLDMGNSLPGGLSRHLWAGSLSEGPNDNAEGCFLSRACHLWRLPQAGLGLGPLLGDPGLHQRFLLPAHILARHYIGFIKGAGGPVNTILSWPAWVPLARMCFSIYLIHRTVMSIVNSYASYRVNASQVSVVVLVCSTSPTTRCSSSTTSSLPCPSASQSPTLSSSCLRLAVEIFLS